MIIKYIWQLKMSKFKEVNNPYLYSSLSNNRLTSSSSFNPYYSNPNSHYFSTHEPISHHNPSFLNQQKIINPLSTYTSYSKQPSPFHAGHISNSSQQDYLSKKIQNPFYRANLLRATKNPEQNSYKRQEDPYQQYRYKQNQQNFVLAPITQEQRQYNLRNYHKGDLAQGLAQLAKKKNRDKQEEERLNYHKSDLAKGLTDFANTKYQQQRQIEQRQNYYKSDMAKGMTDFANKIRKDRQEQEKRQNYFKSDSARGLTDFAYKLQKNKREQQQKQRQRQRQKQNYYKSDMAKGLTDFANNKYRTIRQEEQRENYYKSDMAKGLTNFANAKYKDESQKSQLTKKSSIIQKIDQKQFGSFGKGKNNIGNLKRRINQDADRYVQPQISQVQNGYKYFVDSDQQRQSARFVSYASQKNFPSKIYVKGKTFERIQIN